MAARAVVTMESDLPTGPGRTARSTWPRSASAAATVLFTVVLAGTACGASGPTADEQAWTSLRGAVAQAEAADRLGVRGRLVAAQPIATWDGVVTADEEHFEVWAYGTRLEN